MKKECKSLHSKAVDSLIIAIDHFNRVCDRGRSEIVLILLDRSFELLLKSIIVHRADGDAIREKGRGGMTIGFDLCLRKCLSDSLCKCLSEDDVVALQSLNTLRDAAQHYMVELSEEHLYIYAQSALTLFTKLTKDVLNRPLIKEIPQRILPVCAKPPTDIAALFDIEFEDIKKMVAPKSRKRLIAKAKLRSMAILQSSLDGHKSQPDDDELDKVVNRINKGEGWRDIFPGVATLRVVPEAEGIGISLKISKNSGEAIHLVTEGAPNSTVVAVKRVNELDYYSLGMKDLVKKTGKTQYQLLSIIRINNIQDNDDYFKTITIGKQKHKRYSGKCLKHLNEIIENQINIS